jgi:hypothetical protein
LLLIRDYNGAVELLKKSVRLAPNDSGIRAKLSEAQEAQQQERAKVSQQQFGGFLR